MLILAAGIAFVTLRSDSQLAVATDVDQSTAVSSGAVAAADAGQQQAPASNDGANLDQSAVQAEPADDAAASSDPSAQAQDVDASTATDSAAQAEGVDEAPATDESAAPAQPASIPRAAVSSPEIVGIVNGRITFIADGAPAPDVFVELIASDETGTAGDSIEQLLTDADGRYGFDVADGCYIAIFTAPDGYAFPGVGVTLTGPPVCVTADSPFTVGASIEAVG